MKSMLKASEYADRLRSISIDCGVEWVLRCAVMYWWIYIEWLYQSESTYIPPP